MKKYKKPTESGWYWYSYLAGAPNIGFPERRYTLPVYIWENDGDPFMYSNKENIYLDMISGISEGTTYFIGPIPEPDHDAY